MGDWKLIYATDAAGAVTSGTLNALRSAVMHGADVRLMYKKGDNWWSRECSSACVYRSGTTTVISATYAMALDTERDSKGLALASPVQLERHIYNSTGWRRTATGSTIDAEDRVAMRWYVRDYDIGWIIRPEIVDLIDKLDVMSARPAGQSESPG